MRKLPRRKVLIIAGEGGHAAQAVVLANLLSDADLTREYITAVEDSASGNRANFKLINISKQLKRYRRKWHYIFAIPLVLNSFISFCKTVTQINPSSIISLGPYISIYGLIYCKFKRIKFIHIETRARFKSLSLTYKCVKLLRGKTAYQNCELKKLDPSGLYLGRLE